MLFCPRETQKQWLARPDQPFQPLFQPYFSQFRAILPLNAWKNLSCLGRQKRFLLCVETQKLIERKGRRFWSVEFYILVSSEQFLVGSFLFWGEFYFLGWKSGGYRFLVVISSSSQNSDPAAMFNWTNPKSTDFVQAKCKYEQNIRAFSIPPVRILTNGIL